MKINVFPTVILVFLLLQMAPPKAQAQLRVAVGDFENKSHDLVLDGWARNLPDYLSSELSQSKDILLVERNRLNEIMKEFHLALSGLLNDSSRAGEVGKLAGADVLISGVVTTIGKHYVILAHLTRVKNGEVFVERVEAPDRTHFKEMVRLLANNIKFKLTARGKYQFKQPIDKYPTFYFFAASLIGATGGAILNNQFNQAYKAYEDAGRLDQIDPNYDKAERFYKWRNVAWSVAGSCFLASVVSLIHNRFSKGIRAGSDTSATIRWQAKFNRQEKGVRIGLSLRF